ncbi:hypothetical protein B0J13DRAFT_653258 [Dactylonectria estremocensis]|uniref:Uncharacterized protein n=1 Tax=Dactylonectria estremocensis TaxID=1079267 RepID=A0A9P9DD65_9HYPO|nr:hypothetical protein B0J13DRAFT_653258 [Dactylonectria estremocensis]
MAGPPPSGQSHRQTSLNALGVQFFSSLEGLGVITSAERQLVRGHNLVGAVHLQFFFFDVQLHPYELHFRRKVVDGDESVVGSLEDLYGKLAQVRRQMCLQPVVERSLKHAGGCFPTIAPRASFQGPIDTTSFRFKAGSLSEHQLKCCGFVQCQTYLAPPRDNDAPFKGAQAFHILAYMPYDQQPWKSRIGWMKSSAEGGFVSRKWIYGRGSIIGVLNIALLEKEPAAGHDILVVLLDEFGFTSRATFDGAGSQQRSLPAETKTRAGQGSKPLQQQPSRPVFKTTLGANQCWNGQREVGGKGGCAAIETSVMVSLASEENEAPIQGRNSLKRGASSGRDATPRKRVSSWKVQDAQES